MDLTGIETQLETVAEGGGFYFGPISPALFLDVFLTEGVDHDPAVETIKLCILAAKEGAGRREEQEVEQAKKRKGVSGEGRKPKRSRIEGSSESTPPQTERDMSPELVGGTPFSSHLSVTHSSGDKAQVPAVQVWYPRVCENL